MKRVLALALCLMLCAGMLIGCAGDGTDANHVHTFDYTKWSYDANGHWFNATCDCEVVTEEKLKHVDENKDGACDACKYVYECKDGHTYSEEWSVDCTNHFKLANCGHVTAPYAVAAHADGNGDGVCDTCAYVIEDLHEHYYDTAWTSDAEYHWHAALCEHGVEIADKAAHEKDATGHCTVCGYQLETIAAGDFQAMINAALASNGKVVSANVLASQISMGGSGDDMFVENALTDDVYFVLGPDDTYVFWKSFDALGNFIGADEYWYEYVSDDVVEGVGKTYGSYQLVPVMGDMKLLNGYNYIPGGILPSNSDDTSTLANLISALYAIKTAGVNVSNAVEEYDEEEGVYAFGYNYFTVNATTMSDDTVEYQVYYYETVVTFSVDENFVIDNAMILVDSYRNWELDNDLDYDPTANTVTLKDTANPSRYTYFVAQTSGERTFTTPYPREALIPTDFELYNGKGDWSDDVPPVLLIDEYELIEDTVTFTEGDTVRLFLDDLDPITASAMFINEADITVTAVNKDAESDGVLFVANDFSPYYSKDYGFIGFSAKDAGTYDVTVKYGDVVKTFVAVVEEPQSDVGEIGDNEFVVNTTDTNGYFDLYTFTAEDGEGTYVLTIPAGLGLYSKKAYDSYARPEFDVFDPDADATVAHTVEIELEAGDTYSFYVGAATRGAWVISYGYIASEVEGGDGDNAGSSSASGDLVIGVNEFVFSADEITATYAERTLTVTADGNYQFEGDILISSVTAADGTPAVYDSTTYSYALTAGTYTVRVTVFYNQAGVSYALNIVDINGGNEGGDEGGDDPAPIYPAVTEGENVVNVTADDITNEVINYSLVVTNAGTYSFASNNLMIQICSQDGTLISRNEAYLEEGNYLIKVVTAFVTEPGEYSFTLTYTAPSADEGDGSEANPYVWEELPEEVTFVSDTSNKVYYLFTATESGTVTFTYATADSWADWFEMDGSNTTANNGSSFNKTVMEVPVVAGKTYRIGLGTNLVAGETTVAIAFTAGSEGGEGGEGEEIVTKQEVYEGEENAIDVTADDIAAGKFYLLFAPYMTGEYDFLGDLYVEFVLDANGNSLELNDNYLYDLTADEIYYLEVNVAYVDEGEHYVAPAYSYPEGHSKNPYWYDIYEDNGSYVGDETVANYLADWSPIWYQFYAGATGTLTVTSTNANANLAVCAFPGYELDGTGSVSMPVVKGRLYFISVAYFDATEPVEIPFSATIVPGDIETEGTVNVPHDIVIGSNTASVIEGTQVIFAYTFPSSGILTLTTESADFIWHFAEELGVYVDDVTESTISFEGVMGQTVYLFVNTQTFGSGEVVFTASCELEPTWSYYEGEPIVDGSAANEIVLEDNTYVYFEIEGNGDFIITWDNADAIVEESEVLIANGGVITVDYYTELCIYLPDYAAGVVNLTVTPVGGEGGEEEAESLAGTYTAADDFGNTLDVVITDSEISFTPPMNDTIVLTYEYENGIVTLYRDGVAITNPFAASVEVSAGVPVSMMYNGTSYTLTAGGQGGGEEEAESLAGTYTAADNFGNTLDVVITDSEISFTPPMNDAVVLTYEYENGIVTLYADGVAITNPFAASLSVEDGVPVSMMYNGTSYTLTAGGEGGGDEEESGDCELVVGENTVSVTDGWAGSEVVFVAAEAGRYTFLAGANCVLIYDYTNYFEGESFYVDLNAGDEIMFIVATEDRTEADVNVDVSKSEIGAAVIPSSIEGNYKYADPANWKHRWYITFNADGTGVIAEQNYDGATFSWNAVAEDAFTYTYDAGIVTIDFAEGTIAADGVYSANAEAISGIEIGGASATFEIFT